VRQTNAWSNKGYPERVLIYHKEVYKQWQPMQSFADSIGADGHAPDGLTAVGKAKELIS
jgi:hypothetical protein